MFISVILCVVSLFYYFRSGCLSVIWKKDVKSQIRSIQLADTDSGARLFAYFRALHGTSILTFVSEQRNCNGLAFHYFCKFAEDCGTDSYFAFLPELSTIKAFFTNVILSACDYSSLPAQCFCHPFRFLSAIFQKNYNWEQNLV